MVGELVKWPRSYGMDCQEDIQGLPSISMGLEVVVMGRRGKRREASREDLWRLYVTEDRTVSELARYLDCCENTAYRLLAEVGIARKRPVWKTSSVIRERQGGESR